MGMKAPTRVAAGVIALALFAPTSYAAVPGEDGLIAFTTSRFSESQDICVMDQRGEGRVALIEHPGEERDVAWSPDGTRLAFASDRNGGFSIFVVELSSGEVTQLTNGFYDVEPEWSPDGQEIGFLRAGSAEPQIFVMNADGSDTRRLIDDVGRNPSWSPDGELIAFSNDELDGRADDGGTWARPVVGGEVTRIGGGHDYDWSPRGDEIITTNIYGGGVIVSAVDGSYAYSLRGTRSSNSPSWAPSGNAVAYAASYYRPKKDEVVGGIFVTTIDDRTTLRLLNDAGSVFGSLDWQAKTTSDIQLSQELLPCRMITHDRTLTLRHSGRQFSGRVAVSDGYRPCRPEKLQLKRRSSGTWEHQRWVSVSPRGFFSGRARGAGRYRLEALRYFPRRPSGRIDRCAGEQVRFRAPAS